MMEEKKDNCKKYPEPTVGPIIYNEKGEILLIQCPRWGDYWHIPGGHIEIGETAEQALKREIMEETGLEIDNIEFIGWQDAIEPVGFYIKKHFIFLDYCARMSGGKITKSNEMEEYIWIQPAEALKTLKIDPATIKTINYYLEHIGDKANSIENKYKRALADYQNLLKQTTKEKLEFAKFANEDLLYQILPVYDNLKESLKHSDEVADQNGWLAGIKYIIKQFSDVLNNLGVEEIKTIGKKFDHQQMEAVDSQETENKKEDGLVAREVKPGYKLNSKVIIPAKVVVYKINN